MNLNINTPTSDDEVEDEDDGKIKKFELYNQLSQFNERSDKENLLNLSMNDIETLDSLLNIPAPLTPIFQNDEDFIISESNLKVPQLKSQSQSVQQFCNLPMINVEPANNSTTNNTTNNNNSNQNHNQGHNHHLSQFNFSQITDFNSVSLSNSSVNLNLNSNSNSDSNINNFLLTPFSGEQFNQHRDLSSLSDISSANSPYYSANESIYDDDDIVNDIVNAEPTDELNLSRFDIQGLTLNDDPFLPQRLLTERNLSNLHHSRTNNNSPEINIIIDDPEKQAAKTPSLFSQNSSRRSSMNQDKPEIKIEDTTSNPDSNSFSADGEIRSPTFNFNVDSSNAQNLDSSKRANDASINQNYQHSSSSFLNLPNMNDDKMQDQMRIGRQRRLSQSRSSSRSGSRSMSRSNSVSALSSGFGSGSISRSRSASRSGSISGSGSRSCSRSSSISGSPSIYSENENETNGDKKYVCEICLKDFTRPYNLKSHLRTHTNERPFICKICGKSFARQHDRKRHEDLHTGEKKFQCQGLLQNGECWGCGKRFARTDALRRHFQTESGKECIRKCVEETLTANQDYDADGVAIAMKSAQLYKKSEQKKQ